jgi:hypothetical protein
MTPRLEQSGDGTIPARELRADTGHRSAKIFCGISGISLIIIGLLVLILCVHKSDPAQRHYFVSYSWASNKLGRDGTGSMETIVTPRIQDMNDVNRIRELIQREQRERLKDPNVVILFWQELPGRKAGKK